MYNTITKKELITAKYKNISYIPTIFVQQNFGILKSNVD